MIKAWTCYERLRSLFYRGVVSHRRITDSSCNALAADSGAVGDDGAGVTDMFGTAKEGASDCSRGDDKNQPLGFRGCFCEDGSTAD